MRRDQQSPGGEPRLAAEATPSTVSVIRDEARKHTLRRYFRSDLKPARTSSEKSLRLFPGREVPAFVELVVVDELRIRLLCPAPRGWIEFVREDAHGNRDGDALDSEERRLLVLPIETAARKRRVRQPGDRDVVEDVVAREALGLSVKDARDELIAARVVIEEIRRQADR